MSFDFDHVPALRELVERGGKPGVTYALVPLTKAKTAQEEGWRMSGEHPESPILTISGPDGSIDCMVVWRGASIPSASPESGEREFLIEREVYEATGHGKAPSPAAPKKQAPASVPMEAA